MRLRCLKKDGTATELELGAKPITIGRSKDADVTLADEKVSRLHCGIRLENGDFYLKDLKSRNGTTVNGEKIESVQLQMGDRIQVGSTTFIFEEDDPMQTEFSVQAVEDDMAQGKGYSTILKEIVRTMDEPETPAEPPPPKPKKVRIARKKNSSG